MSGNNNNHLFEEEDTNLRDPSECSSMLICTCTCSPSDEESVLDSLKKNKRVGGNSTIVCCCYSDGEVLLQDVITGEGHTIIQMPCVVTCCRFVCDRNGPEKTIYLLLSSGKYLFATMAQSPWNRSLVQLCQELQKNLYVSSIPRSFLLTENKTSDITCIAGTFISTSMLLFLAIGHYNGNVSFIIASKDLTHFQELKSNKKMLNTSNLEASIGNALVSSSDMGLFSGLTKDEARTLNRATRDIHIFYRKNMSFRGNELPKDGHLQIAILYTNGILRIYTLSHVITQTTFELLLISMKHIPTMDSCLQLKMFIICGRVDKTKQENRYCAMVCGKDVVQLFVDENALSSTSSSIAFSPLQTYKAFTMRPISRNLEKEHIYTNAGATISSNHLVIYCADQYGNLFKNRISLRKEIFSSQYHPRQSTIQIGSIVFQEMEMSMIKDKQMHSFAVGCVVSSCLSKVFFYDHLNHVCEI